MATREMMSGQVHLVQHLQHQIRHLQMCNGRLGMEAQHAARANQYERFQHAMQHGGTIARLAAIKNASAAAAADASRHAEAEKVQAKEVRVPYYEIRVVHPGLVRVPYTSTSRTFAREMCV